MVLQDVVVEKQPELEPGGCSELARVETAADLIFGFFSGLALKTAAAAATARLIINEARTKMR